MLAISNLTKRTVHALLSNVIINTTRKMADTAAMPRKGLSLPVVLEKLTEYASPSYAETWDNVGLLLEPSPPHVVEHVFLTNDLTEEVLEEAIDKRASLIVSYHPPIFSGIKRITQDRWKDRLVVKCMENRIALYSPHTSYDVVKGLFPVSLFYLA